MFAPLCSSGVPIRMSRLVRPTPLPMRKYLGFSFHMEKMFFHTSVRPVNVASPRPRAWPTSRGVWASVSSARAAATSETVSWPALAFA